MASSRRQPSVLPVSSPPPAGWTPPATSGPEEFRKRFNAKDWRGVEEILKKNPTLLNAPDENGMTPLQTAITDGNVDMLVELLKRDDLKMGDALLHAVGKGERKLVDLVMASMNKRDLPMDAPFEDTTHYKFYMTPLMLACHNENYDLIGLFLQKGHILEIPHGAECGCQSCVSHHPSGERLEDKMRRIDCYTAASSTAFVLHQDDPFAWAISFSRYLEKCKEVDPSYGLVYDERIKKLNEVTVSLISDCDKQDVIEAVLKRRSKIESKNACVFGFPRVHEALDAHQKLFLAQPSCHSVMYTAYCGSWSDHFGVRRGQRVLRFLTHTFLYPFAALLYLITCGKIPSSFKNPTCRFTSSLCSYLTFIAALIFYAQYAEERHRLGIPSRFEKIAALVYIFAYTAGMWAVFITDLKRLGTGRCFDVWWRQYDFVLLIVWAGTFFAYMDAIGTALGHSMFDLHRVHWRPAEPQLIYEIWFTWAAIMSGVRLFFYGQVLSRFGVVTISIYRCIPTILQYVVVLFVVLISFAIGLNHMYEHYKDNVVVRDGKEIPQPFQLTSFFTVARYLYWAYYGYLPPDTFGVIVGNVGHGDTVVEQSHHLISNTGELMSGVYHVIELVILLNLMVSIMTAAAVSVVDNEHIEWKFICAEIWMEFFQDSRTLPPPFNLLQLAINLPMYIINKIRRKGPLSAWDSKYQPPPDDAKQEQEYKEVISSLKGRMRMKLDSGKSESEGGKGGKGGGGPAWTKAGKGDIDDLASVITQSGRARQPPGIGQLKQSGPIVGPSSSSRTPAGRGEVVDT